MGRWQPGLTGVLYACIGTDDRLRDSAAPGGYRSRGTTHRCGKLQHREEEGPERVVQGLSIYVTIRSERYV